MIMANNVSVHSLSLVELEVEAVIQPLFAVVFGAKPSPQ